MTEDDQRPIVQFLDSKKAESGIYHQDKIYRTSKSLSFFMDKNLTCWKHADFLDEEKCNYLYLYTSGAPLSSFSENELEFEQISRLLESHRLAAITSKINLGTASFYDVIPPAHLMAWFRVRSKALQLISERVKKPDNYDILHKIHVVTSEMSGNPVSFSGEKKKIEYNIFGSATGRLAHAPGSFPILNLNKNQRQQVVPKNDLFLELDLNGAEIRTLLSYSGQEQPQYDIHDFNKRVLRLQNATRQEVKSRFFAWLYNPDAEDRYLEKFYDKAVFKKYYKNNMIRTPFGRSIEVDHRKALNYLTQSTTSDIVLNNAYQIMKLLSHRRSFLAFTMHDSVVLDFAKEDHDMVHQIKEVFEKNCLGKFLSNLKIGKSFGKMKEIKL